MSDFLRATTGSSKALSLEPYVDHFCIENSEKKGLMFPFQLMSYLLLFFVIMGYYFWAFQGSTSITYIVIWLYLIFAPFYIPGIYHFYSYLSNEKGKEIEIDFKNRLMKYVDRERGMNLLFHRDQVEKMTLCMSRMFPYGVDYISLELKGGPTIHISSLVVHPGTIIDSMEMEFEIRERFFNSFPRVS